MHDNPTENTRICCPRVAIIVGVTHEMAAVSTMEGRQDSFSASWYVTLTFWTQYSSRRSAWLARKQSNCSCGLRSALRSPLRKCSAQASSE